MYRYQEYPRMMYRAGNEPRLAHNDADKAEAIANGWSTEPVSDELPAPAEEPATEPAAPQKRRKK